MSTLGSQNNDFPGNVRVGRPMLDADQVASDWTHNEIWMAPWAPEA